MLIDDLVGQVAIELGQMVIFGLVTGETLARGAKLRLQPCQARPRESSLRSGPIRSSHRAGPCRAFARACWQPPMTFGWSMSGRATRHQLVHWLERIEALTRPALPASRSARPAKGELARIHAVIAAIDQRHGGIDHREAERAFLHRVAHSLFDRRDPLFRNRAAVDLLFEAEAFAAAQAGGLR